MQASFLGGQSLVKRNVFPVAPARQTLVIQNAQKKGSGSTKNGRDSISKRRGVKVFGGQYVKAGGIIVRQLGTKWYSGNNTDLGKDYTLFSLIDGIVKFDKARERPKVHVYPLEHPASQAAIQATHTKQPAEGTLPRKERRKEMFLPRDPAARAATLAAREAKAAAAAAAASGASEPPADAQAAQL